LPFGSCCDTSAVRETGRALSKGHEGEHTIPKERFWQIIQAYNLRMWPVQVVMYLATLVLVLLLFVRPTRLLSLLLEIYFSIAFALTGVAFYLLLAGGMAGNSSGNYFLGLLFLVVSVLFLLDVFRGGLTLGVPAAGARKCLTPVLTVCTLCYPLAGIVLGHSVRESIVPGAFPCPTVALCLLVLTTALPKVRRTVTILLLFCAIPFTIPFQVLRYGVYEDVVLFVTGIYSLILLVRYWKPRRPEGTGSVAA
jgi:hypothetical protein